jgi:hypothetical protein
MVRTFCKRIVNVGALGGLVFLIPGMLCALLGAWVAVAILACLGVFALGIEVTGTVVGKYVTHLIKVEEIAYSQGGAKA